MSIPDRIVLKWAKRDYKKVTPKDHTPVVIYKG